MGLKDLIYEKPYLNEVDRSAPDGFEIKEHVEIKEKITVYGNEDIMNLFRMTPYYYKTGKSDQEKLYNIGSLETEIEFGIDLMKKVWFSLQCWFFVLFTHYFTKSYCF